MPKIYLDYQTATPLLPEVAAAMEPYWQERFGQASSLHLYGLQARDALKVAREECAAFIQARDPEEIHFTSDGTEAMNLAVKGTAWANRQRGNHIVTSAIEHPGVLRSIEFLEQQGFECTRVPVDKFGFISPAAIADAVTDQTILIATHLANHDLGTIQSVGEIGGIAAERGIPFFVDAEAAAGWVPIDVNAFNASLVSFSPHRFGGPKGVGVLYRNRRVPVTPLIHGGEQERGLRAGVENIPAIVGAGAAVQNQPSHLAAVSELQTDLWNQIEEQCEYHVLNGPVPDGGKRRIPNSLNISFEFLEGEGIALAGDMRGLVIASGPACHGRALKVSPTLNAIGRSDALARANVILSLGPQTTKEEISEGARILVATVERLRGMSDSWEEFQRKQQTS
jgi:cysteine desulfurase